MKTYFLRKSFVIAILAVAAFSCRRSTEVSIRMMNSKCKVKLGNSFNIDSLKIDSSLTNVENENISKLLPDIEDPTQWNVLYHGRRKMGKLKLFSLILSNGENRSVRLVIIKDKTPTGNIEVASNNQLEGYSYKISSTIPDDSTIITKKYQYNQTDEPSELTDSNDSIITIYRLKPDGLFTIIKCDTIPVTLQFTAPDDGEYSDEIFYYNGLSPSSWAVAGITNPRAFKDFYMQFRNMVKLNDKDQIAIYINYPLGSIKDEETFIKNYDKTFTKEIRNAILGQKIRQLFRDQRGVMIGDNQVWFKQINGEYKIVKIK